MCVGGRRTLKADVWYGFGVKVDGERERELWYFGIGRMD